MDRKAIIVLLVCFVLFFFVWPKLVNQIFPPKPLPKQTNTVAAFTNAPGTLTNQPALSASTNPPTVTATPPAPIATNVPEEVLIVTNENARYTFTSHGGGLKSIELFKYPQRVVCRDKSASSPPAALNVPGPLAIFALLPNELLQGDGVFKLSPIPNGVRAEKTLSNQLVWIKEFRPTSNYLVEATARLENHSGQPLAIPAQEWNIGTAGPMAVTDNPMDLGILWFDGQRKTSQGDAWFANRTLGCFAGTPRTQYIAGQSNVVWGEVHNQFFTLALMPEQPGAQIAANKITFPSPSREVLASNPRANPSPFGFQGSIVFAATNLPPHEAIQQNFKLYAGPKENRILERIAFQMKNEIDVPKRCSGR